MSFLLSPATTTTTKDFTILHSNCGSKKKHRNILKAKENTYKHKCIKALKNKLKKYKLRHDGSEDQDVLDVSEILIKSLYIKSPKRQSNIQNNNCFVDENYPRNYLFKMGRKKHLLKNIERSDLNGPFSNQTIDVDKNSIPLTEGKEKQQTNAFKLLMDSRNKSIGSNSPGKEKPIYEKEAQEIAEKKNLKVKRSLALQKMAEGKGSLKNKEIEEYQEYCINKKMEKRAERLKNMITSNVTVKKSEKVINVDSKKSKETAPDLLTNEEVSKQKTLTLISLFNDSVIQNNISSKSKVSKADSEFLKKLSPSLKKKENMLCYFKKVEKEIPLSNDMDDENCDINEDVVIKVKLSSKLKKKVKKKKVSKVNSENLETEGASVDCIEISSDVAVDNQQSESNTSKDRRKRKRHGYVDGIILNNSNCKAINTPATECRPKRNIKKPVKYNDDVDVFSSDDDLHIFTPKKKRQDNKIPMKTTKIEHKTNSKYAPEVDRKSDVSLKSKSDIKINKKPKKVNDALKVQKNNVKLAPIFAVKTQLDPASIEAKQKFLQSGVPDKLKKIISADKKRTVEQYIFPITVHIQQNTNNRFYIPTEIICNFLRDVSEIELNLPLEDNLFQSILDILDNRKPEKIVTLKCDKLSMLQKIKKSYPKFPVYRTYRLLTEKKSGEIKDCSYQDLDNSTDIIQNLPDLINESPEKLNWCDKYKANSSKHIIGNFESIRELRKWLVTWTENEVKSRNKVSFESDSSDFCHSDSDSKDSAKTNNNLLFITGPVGSGKTSSVYTVAAELAIKVIEVNSSSKRTGKIMLQDLQEATQSHKVNRGKSSTENSQKSQEIFENKKSLHKRGRSKADRSIKNEYLSQSQTTNSQESVRTEMSLILIDDADIVFDQDDGFSSAIVQLVQSSKRPVILISSSASCTHLQRFAQNAKNINMHPFQPRMLGTWLDIMCLADSGVCVPGTGATVLDFYKGDIRKTINSLQFYVSSQIEPENDTESNIQNSDSVPFMDDENSSMSWTENFNTEERLSSVKSFDYRLCKYIIGQQLTLSQGHHSLDLFNVWWSIPKLLINPINFEHVKEQNLENIESQNIPQTVKMEAIANALDSISVAEYYRPKYAMLNDITRDPWFSEEGDSVSENEVMFDYNRNKETIEEISHKLLLGSIFEAQNILNIKDNTDVQFPSMDLRRERDRVVSRHHSLSHSFNPFAVLDRKAVALDYWSYCRAICRVEKSKTDNNSKRNNRFCHYLKSLNVMCKTEYFDKLADSLHPTSELKEEVRLEIE